MRRDQIMLLVVMAAAGMTACSGPSGEERLYSRAAIERETERETASLEVPEGDWEIQLEEESETETTEAAQAEPGADSSAAQRPGTAGQGNTNQGSTGQGTAASSRPQQSAGSVTPLNKTMYATASVRVRKSSSTDSEIVSGLAVGQSVKVTGKTSNGWMQVSYDGQTAYVSGRYLSDTAPEPKETERETEAAPKAESDSNVSVYPGDENDPPADPGGIPIVPPLQITGSGVPQQGNSAVGPSGSSGSASGAVSGPAGGTPAGTVLQPVSGPGV